VTFPFPWLLVAGVVFLLMEPVTYLVHRYVMHGPGMGWHASHHGPRRGRFERNDLFPVCFASITIAVMAVGAAFPALAVLLPIGAGITAYGVTYLFVHDVYAHRRLGRRIVRSSTLDRLASAHRIHHQHGEEPYGFLLPVTRPRERSGGVDVRPRR
jgi:beta-carotene 3-hydroxylase